MKINRLTKHERGIVLNKITDLLVKKPEIIFAYVFGSFIYNIGNKFKDIDLAVYLNDLYSAGILAYVEDEITS